jgi:hypothetical protein
MMLIVSLSYVNDKLSAQMVLVVLCANVRSQTIALPFLKAII